MTLPETADAINLVASDWAARVDRGLTDVEAAQLAAWLAVDARRIGAYMRMTAVLTGTETAPGVTRAAHDRRRAANGVSRRSWLIGSGALAASVVGAGVYLAALNRPVVYETSKGEKRVIALEDGSIVTLNTATRLEVRYSREQRLISLAGGEALFDVAKDPARPFVVRADEADLRAVGTSFSVAGGTGRPVKVLVREGLVDVVRREAAVQPMRLAANTRAVINTAPAPMVIDKVDPTEISRELAWREGRLVFAGESLSAAAAEFARYSDIRIVIADPALAGSGVAGVFDINDPIGFAQATALSLGARAQVREGRVLITR